MKHLIENSTIHGVTHVYSTKNKIFKIFWMSLIILGIAGIAANMGYVIDKYLKYPVDISITFEPFKWPEFTLCNPTDPFIIKVNSSNYKYWKEILHKIDNLISKDRYVQNNWKYKMSIAMSTIDRQRFKFDFYSYLTSFDFIENGIYPIRLDYRWIYVRPEWLITNRMVYIDYNVPCYSLKLENPSVDVSRNLELAFNLNYHSNEISNRRFKPRSFYMFIDNVDELPQGKPYILTPGYKYTFDISQTRYRQIKSCRTEKFMTDLYDPSMIYSTLYEGGYYDCRRFVWQKYTLERCKCYMYGYPIHKNGSEFPRQCYNASLFSTKEIVNNERCVKNLFRSGNPFIEECEKYIQRKCDWNSYKVSIQKENLFQKARVIDQKEKDELFQRYGELFPEYNNKTDLIDILSDNIFQVVLKRENEFADVRKEDYSYIPSQLFSDIGGLMGLCLGISAVGIFEIAVLLYHYTKSICKENRESAKEPSNAKDIEL